MIAKTRFEEPLVAAPKYRGITSIYKVMWNPEKMQYLLEIIGSQMYVHLLRWVRAPFISHPAHEFRECIECAHVPIYAAEFQRVIS